MIQPSDVHEVLSRHQLADGVQVVFDLEKSHGSWLHDATTGREYLDFFTCFASWPIGYNHPGMADPEFQREILQAALCNPSNSDIYTVAMARFVEAFATRATPEGFPHHFWISGGALAVENTLKCAFDWKARKLGRTGMHEEVNDLVVVHFKDSFHGRSGYTMSLTNTDPAKIGLFPKFDWPRIHNPGIEFDLDGGIANDVEASEARALQEIEAAFARRGEEVAAILIEPMQGEGGDVHFRPEFLRELRRFADEREAMLIFDEVQTGFWGTGELPWLWQKLGVAPDLVAFSKKTQVGGFYSSRRVEEVADHVFSLSSRINSTWGGTLVDMVRSRRLIEIILEEELGANVARQGERMLAGLRRIAAERGGYTNVRGTGSMIAFSLPSAEVRDKLRAELVDKGLFCLACGHDSLRFRMPLTVSAEEVDEALDRVSDCLPVSAS